MRARRRQREQQLDVSHFGGPPWGLREGGRRSSGSRALPIAVCAARSGAGLPSAHPIELVQANLNEPGSQVLAERPPLGHPPLLPWTVEGKTAGLEHNGKAQIDSKREVTRGG